MSAVNGVSLMEHDSGHAIAPPIPPEVTVGAGKRRPQGRRLTLGGVEPLAVELADVLRRLPRRLESWWSPGTFEHDYRDTTNWRGSFVIGVDLDYLDANGKHVAVPPEIAEAAMHALRNGAPGNLAHSTPRGLRDVLVLCAVERDGARWETAARGACSLIARWLADAGIAATGDRPRNGYSIDRASWDRARMLWAPRALVDDVQRDAEIHLLREQPYVVDELLAAYEAEQRSHQTNDVRAKKTTRGKRTAEASEKAEAGGVYAPTLDVNAWAPRYGRVVTKTKPYGADRSATLFELDGCPLDAAHADGAAFVIKFASGVVVAKCMHNGCAGKGWRDWLAAVGDQDIAPEATTGLSGERELRCSYLSVLTVVREDRAEVVGGQLAFDEMRRAPMLGDRELRDVDVSAIRARLEERIQATSNSGWLEAGVSDLYAAILQVASERPYHPVRDYLSLLKWDGTPRIEHVPSMILRAADTPIYKTILRRWFVSAVARTFSPGCKVDTVLVLVGPQGAMKSTFFGVLAGEWFCDSAIDIHSKDAYATMQRSWIVEWSELESLRRARDAEAVKAFLSSKIDTYRPPYGKLDVTVPRTSIIVGTSNPKEFLEDPTGNRRWWPVCTGPINIEQLIAWRDQLWAEAVALYQTGEQWWLTLEEDAALAVMQHGHETTDPWTDLVVAWAASPRWGVVLPDEKVSALRPDVTTANVLRYALEKPIGQWNRSDENRVGKILTRAGYCKNGERVGGKSGPRVWGSIE